MRKLALFDIDGTLVTGRGTEQRFAASMLVAGQVSWRQIGAFAWFAARYAPRFGRHVLKKDKAWLAGLATADVAEAAGAWVRAELAPCLFDPCVARLRAHLADGDEVALLSGTPDFIAEAIAGLLGVSFAVGSECATKQGRFVGSPPTRHPFGAAKRGIAREISTQHGFDPADVVAYGDSMHDLALLESVGRAIAVRPDAGLARVARERGWEILGDRRAPVGRIASSPIR